MRPLNKVKRKIILIDPSGDMVLHFIENWDVLLIVAMTSDIKKEIQCVIGQKEIDVLDISDLLNLPHQPGINITLLHEYRHIEGDFLYNNMRIYGSAPKVRYIYFNCLAFWNNLINDKKPDLIYSSTDLHAQSFDIIPLEIASKRNILAVFSPPVSAYKQPLTLLVKYKNRELIDAFDDRINIDLIKRTIFEGESSRKSILHMAIDLLSEKKIRILISKALTYIKSVLSSIFPYMLRTFFLSLFKGFRSDYHTGSGKVIIKDHHFISHTLVSYLYMIFGRLHYFKISTPILPKEKFVYMSLHMEPEAVLVNSSLNQQLYLAEMLANSLPAGWKLLVKEHPHQFKLSMSHMYYFLVNLPLMKWFGSYKRLSSIENISLLSVSVNSETVLKKASAVFTVAGSVALEAVVERVPVMCPTGSFYIRLSPSIREISCQEDIREFLLALDSTDKTEQTTNSDSLAYRKMILNDSGGFGTEIISRALHRELEV